MPQVRNPIRASVNGANSIVLPEDSARLDPILVQNLSEEVVYLDFGQPADIADGWPVPPGDVLRFTSVLAINAITAGGAATLAILVGGDTQESGDGGSPSGSASDPTHVEINGSVSLPVDIQSFPLGVPTGTALDPVHVNTNGPAGTAGDPLYVAGGLSVDDANTARTTATHVLPTQHVDATGKVMPAGDLVGNAIWTRVGNGTAEVAISAANTARTTGTIVAPVQVVDATGKVPPAGDAAGNAPYANLALAGTAISSSAPLPAYNPKLGATYTARVAVSVTGASSAQVVAASARKGLILKAAIANTDVIWLAWDSADAAATYGLPLEPGETREYWGERCPVTKLNGLVGSGTQTLYVEEIT